MTNPTNHKPAPDDKHADGLPPEWVILSLRSGAKLCGGFRPPPDVEDDAGAPLELSIADLLESGEPIELSPVFDYISQVLAGPNDDVQRRAFMLPHDVTDSDTTLHVVADEVIFFQLLSEMPAHNRRTYEEMVKTAIGAGAKVRARASGLVVPGQT